jgi:hypothetical protein
MAASEKDGVGRFIGFFRLVDACAKPGCPVCRCLVADARQYLGALLYEHVNDPDTRRRLRGSWGFCGWHTWMLRDLADPAFGSAVIHEDLLRVLGQRVRRQWSVRRPGSPGLLGWLRRLLGQGRRPLLAELRDRRPTCSACQESMEAESRYLDAALRYAEDPQFDRAYARSDGLCLPHVVRVLERDSTGLAEPLVAGTVQKWEALRKDLRAFIEKHDYRNAATFTEAEGLSYLRAFEVVAGAPGVFGKDVRLRSPGQRRAPSRRDRPPDWPASPEDLAVFDRAQLELRVKELTEQLGDATTQAAALHYRLAQVAKDRNNLEMNVSGERAANMLGERMIAELRAEIRQLRDELGRPRPSESG